MIESGISFREVRVRVFSSKPISILIIFLVSGVIFYFINSDRERPGDCPQDRETVAAPETYSTMKNTLEPTQENILAGKQIFNTTAKPIPCIICHGIKADGLGLIYPHLKPFSRNFTCYQTMKDVSDGQLFWVIQKGSHGTRMPGFAKLEEKEIWQLVHYIRDMEKKDNTNDS